MNARRKFFAEGLTPYVGTRCIFRTEESIMHRLTISQLAKRARANVEAVDIGHSNLLPISD
jgi:hypothetical protein